MDLIGRLCRARGGEQFYDHQGDKQKKSLPAPPPDEDPLAFPTTPPGTPSGGQTKVGGEPSKKVELATDGTSPKYEKEKVDADYQLNLHGEMVDTIDDIMDLR